MKSKRSLSHFLPRKPHTIDEHNWFYLEPKGICFVHETYSAREEWITTEQIIISWAKIEKALSDFKKAKVKQDHSKLAGRGRNNKPTN